MNLNEYSPYFGIKPTDLGDEDFIHLITFFKLLNLVENPMVSLVIPVYLGPLYKLLLPLLLQGLSVLHG